MPHWIPLTKVRTKKVMQEGQCVKNFRGQLGLGQFGPLGFGLGAGSLGHVCLVPTEGPMDRKARLPALT